ncbi:glycoside hydrolase family 28 protein [Baudoinia panamericana UAMH 10762]|uniref:galacturonan 1,4-alpha-galacturonidase n=1 Tax=Baudoinia panamericana (strain UAMH 10762) TaxID=717646 RepID=M2LC46_BAUPA|nr:glycoside hydrolase family 28 protein [Baudoinia panamericana UAMH 10762]EMC91492.1 glycoside hydrolase family 28 protein [Baudoinia panamericana UAMH 10762]
MYIASFAATAVAQWHWGGQHGGGAPGTVQVSGGKTCIVYAHGGNVSDVSNILQAFSQCNDGGTIIFPQGQNYFIDSKLNPVVNDITIQWQGTWTFSPNITYWRQPANHYPIFFQNHAASFVLTGDGIHIDGYGTGGIYGNGDVWYTAEAGNTQPGRPMPFVFWNVSDVTVSNFFVKDPPLWSLNIMNGTDMLFTNITCNATATQAPYGKNWVQNTDGFDTMDANNVRLENFVYQGGDDCIALKPRSYNIFVQNASCHGGNGMAIGSLGQYLEDSSVENVVVDNVRIIRYNNDMETSAYIKTWVGVLVNQSGYESDFQPRGGGWGSVRNILFSNFEVMGADGGPTITEDSGDNGTVPGTSLMEISNVAFVNFTGYLSGNERNGNRTASVSCSNVHPCYNIAIENVTLTTNQNTTATGTATCSYISPGGVHGISGSGC